MVRTDTMHVIHARAGGPDVHKMQSTATVRVARPGAEAEVFTRQFSGVSGSVHEPDRDPFGLRRFDGGEEITVAGEHRRRIGSDAWPPARRRRARASSRRAFAGRTDCPDRRGRGRPDGLGFEVPQRSLTPWTVVGKADSEDASTFSPNGQVEARNEKVWEAGDGK